MRDPNDEMNTNASHNSTISINRPAFVMRREIILRMLTSLLEVLLNPRTRRPITLPPTVLLSKEVANLYERVVANAFVQITRFRLRSGVALENSKKNLYGVGYSMDMFQIFLLTRGKSYINQGIVLRYSEMISYSIILSKLYPSQRSLIAKSLKAEISRLSEIFWNTDRGSTWMVWVTVFDGKIERSWRGRKCDGNLSLAIIRCNTTATVSGLAIGNG